jgi:hypothetical protein
MRNIFGKKFREIFIEKRNLVPECIILEDEKKYNIHIDERMKNFVLFDENFDMVYLCRMDTDLLSEMMKTDLVCETFDKIRQHFGFLK